MNHLNRNTIAIVHLSDIHLVAKRDANPLLRRALPLAAAVRARPELAVDTAHCFIVLSGDIAFSGSSDEYAHASEFLRSLTEQLGAAFSCPVSAVVVPGNHDCDFSVSDSVRDTLIQNVPPSVDQVFLSSCAKVQTNFRAFAEKHGCAYANPLQNYLSYNIGDRSVTFQLLNSAWMSTKVERQGQLSMPVELLTRPACLEHAAAVVSVFHHPYNWYVAATAQGFREHVEQTSDLILTGHEHTPDKYSKVRPGQFNEFLEGGVLQHDKDPNDSSFHVIAIDLHKQSYSTTTLKWSKDMYEPVTTYPTAPFQRNQHRTRNHFQLLDTARAALADPGSPYRHPRRKNLELSDFFVYPDLQERNATDGQTDIPRFAGDALAYVLRSKQVLLTGAELTGKSAMARTLFRDFHRRGLVPVSLSGQQLSDPDPQRVHATIDRRFGELYDPGLLERFRQLPPEERAVIVDDWSATPLALVHHDTVAHILTSFFGVCVLLASDEYELRLLDGLQPNAHLWTFTRASLQPLGHAKRYELVRRWCTLARGNQDEPSSVSRETERTDRTVTKLIGDKLLPSLPALVLLFLQALDSPTARTDDLGSFGHLYEALIVDALSTGPRAVAIDAKQAFLTEYASLVFESGSATFEDAYSSYCAQYHVDPDRERLLQDLLNSSLLERKHGNVGFKYKYVYFYFVAKHLRDNLEHPETRARIQALATSLHLEESANVLLFLCHLCKDSFVLTTVLNAARALMAGELVLDFEQPLVVLSPQYSPNLQLRDGTTEDHRLALRRRRDEADVINGSVGTEELPSELWDLVAARKTVQIIGQILRGFPGSIRGEIKAELALECYRLGMRSASHVLSLFHEHQDSLGDLFAAVLLARKPKADADGPAFRDLIQRILYALWEGTCLAYILEVADAVGAEGLTRTYEEVLRQDARASFRLIDVAIRLDQFDAFPQQVVEGLDKDFRGSFVPHRLLRRLILRHLYLFPVSYDSQQRLCERFDIKLPATAVVAPKRIAPPREEGRRAAISSKDSSQRRREAKRAKKHVKLKQRRK
jgi:hypothetical protein